MLTVATKPAGYTSASSTSGMIAPSLGVINSVKKDDYRPREKIWGSTWKIAHEPAFEVWGLKIEPRAHCSRHKHQNKWNKFLILSGSLTVQLFSWKSAEHPEEVFTLGPGEGLTVPPGVWHRFHTHDQPCEAIEMYWVSVIDPDDIDRADVGGRWIDTGE